MPLEDEQGDEHRRQRDDVGHDRAEGTGDRTLCADHVIVHAADQGACLRTGEERDRHALHVIEQCDAEVEDEALTNPRRPPSFEQGQHGPTEGAGQKDCRENVELMAVAQEDGVVDHAPEEQRRQELQHRLGDDDDHETDQHPPVTGRVREHAARRALLEFGVAQPLGIAHRVHDSHRAGRMHGRQPRGAH